MNHIRGRIVFLYNVGSTHRLIRVNPKPLFVGLVYFLMDQHSTTITVLSSGSFSEIPYWRVEE